MGDGTVKWKMKSSVLTRVIMWLLCKHGIEASKVWVWITHWVNSFNTIMPMLCRDIQFIVPMSHYFKHAGWYGLSGFEFLVAGQLFIQNGMHACLFIKCTTHLNPSPVDNLLRSGLAVLPDNNDPTCFKMYKNHFNIDMNFKYSTMQLRDILKCFKRYHHSTLLISQRKTRRVMVMDDLLPPPLFNVNWPSHSEIQLFPNLTMKILGQHHVYGQKSRSHLTLKIQRSRSLPRSNQLVTFEAWSSFDMFAFRFVAIWPFFGWDMANSIFKVKLMAKVKPDDHIWGIKFNRSICLLFISWQSDNSGLRYSKFHIWPWKFKV